MNQKSFCEASNLINKREDKRVTIYLKSGEKFSAEMNRKEIYEKFVVFEYTCYGAENDKSFRLVPFENIESISF